MSVYEFYTEILNLSSLSTLFLTLKIIFKNYFNQMVLCNLFKQRKSKNIIANILFLFSLNFNIVSLQEIQHNWYRDSTPPISSIVNENNNSNNIFSSLNKKSFVPTYVNHDDSLHLQRSKILPTNQQEIAFYQPNQNFNNNFNIEKASNKRNEAKKLPLLLISKFLSYNNIDEKLKNKRNSVTFPYVPYFTTAPTSFQLDSKPASSIYSNYIKPPSITPEIYGNTLNFINIKNFLRCCTTITIL